MSEEKPPERRPAPGQGIQLSIDESEAQGIYSNLALISHSNSEVIIDFARTLPGITKTKVHARIILTAPNAKALHRALGENLTKFEDQYGPISTTGHPEPGKGIGFKS
jgi:hypothetical protein